MQSMSIDSSKNLCSSSADNGRGGERGLPRRLSRWSVARLPDAAPEANPAEREPKEAGEQAWRSCCGRCVGVSASAPSGRPRRWSARGQAAPNPRRKQVFQRDPEDRCQSRQLKIAHPPHPAFDPRDDVARNVPTGQLASRGERGLRPCPLRPRAAYLRSADTQEFGLRVEIHT